MSKDADDPETAEPPVPAPEQVIKGRYTDLLSRFAAEGTEDALNVLPCYERSECLMLTKRTQVKITGFFFPENKFISPEPLVFYCCYFKRKLLAHC